jgi:hypothetical protein
VRSYGVRRLEEENERKYQRQLVKMQQTHQQQSQKMLLDLHHKGSSPNLISSSSLGSGVFAASSFGSYAVSCRTPLSTDDLLPSVRELVEVRKLKFANMAQISNFSCCDGFCYYLRLKLLPYFYLQTFFLKPYFFNRFSVANLFLLLDGNTKHLLFFNEF